MAGGSAGIPGRRKSGIVIPHRVGWGAKVAAWWVHRLIRVVAGTCRFRWRYPEAVLEHRKEPVIFCIWHNRLALGLIMYERFLRHLGHSPGLAAMVSASRDGGMLAQVLEHFGVQPVRGSTSRRGPQALLELTSWAERGYDLAITPDGPRGPRYVAQPGVIALAQLTGRPIVPLCYGLSWKICLKSWDGFQVPLPFGPVEMGLGEPLVVPANASEEEREALRIELERRLKALTVD